MKYIYINFKNYFQKLRRQQQYQHIFDTTIILILNISKIMFALTSYAN
jgi:hypothetical protein